MAFEGLTDYVDYLAEQYREDGDIKWMLAMVEYERIAIRSAKFKGQRHYCRKKIYEINPQFYKGYYKQEKPV